MNLNSINESISRIQKIQEEIKSSEYKDAYDICKKEFDEIKRREEMIRETVRSKQRKRTKMKPSSKLFWWMEIIEVINIS